MTLFIATFCFSLGYYGTEAFGISPKATQAISITGTIFEIAFICMLSYLMLDVNKHLAIFFNKVAITNYPKKLIAFILAMFFVFVI